MSRFCLIGPTYPYRGGIAHYTTLLAQALAERHETLFISFTRQYPGWLFPGRSDRDPSRRPLQTKVTYLLDPLNPISWRRTVQQIGRWRPDAVVIPWWVPYWAPAWAAVGRAVKRLPGKPRLLFICHNVLPHEPGMLDKAALRLALGPGDGFVVHSQADADRLREQFHQARFRVSPHPTYAALGDAAAGKLPAEIPADRPLLLFCGLVRPYKGLDILLEAMPLVLARRPVHLLVAGEFWQGAAAFENQIEALGIGQSVTLVDAYLSNDDLAATIDRADVLVLPYRSATQSGLVQAAFGRCKPVITTAVGGLPEVVHDGLNGLVVPPADPLSLAEAIDRYFNEGLQQRFSDNIAQQQDRFEWQVMVETLESLLD